MKNTWLLSLPFLAFFLFGCAATSTSSSPSASISSEASSVIPSSNTTSDPSVDSSKSGGDSIFSQPSSSPVLGSLYLYDEETHWKEYIGDDTHQRIDEAPHVFAAWTSEDGGMQRVCTVCDYVQNHKHEYGGEYEHDSEHHWKVDTCGHGTIGEYGEHEYQARYFRGQNGLIVRQECTVCGYYAEEDTYNADLLSKLTYSLTETKATIRSFGEASEWRVLNIPSEIEGKPVYQANNNSPAPSWTFETTEKGVVYMPSSISSWSGPFLNRAEVDFCFDGTLEDWMNLKSHSGAALRSANLYLPDGNGEFHFVKDLVLPDSTKKVPFDSFEKLSIQTVTCNSDLESIEAYAFYNCESLREIHLNEGLKTFEFSSIAKTRVTSIALPSTLTRIGESIDIHHLYSITISKGVTARITSQSFSWMTKLVELRDLRGVEHDPYITKIPLLCDENGPRDFHLVYKDDFVFARYGENAKLIDYLGKDRHISLPESFADGNKAINKYTISATFFENDTMYVNGRGGHSEDYVCNYRHADYVFGVTIPSAVISIEAGALTTPYAALEEVYFQMDKAKMESIIQGDLSMTNIRQRDFYFLDEEGEYVRHEASLPSSNP